MAPGRSSRAATTLGVAVAPAGNSDMMPAVAHIGFDKIAVKGKIAFPSDFFHYLHHRHFECNYGNTLFPADRWFGTFHDGSPETHARMVERLQARRAANHETGE